MLPQPPFRNTAIYTRIDSAALVIDVYADDHGLRGAARAGHGDDPPYGAPRTCWDTADEVKGNALAAALTEPWCTTLEGASLGVGTSGLQRLDACRERRSG